MMDEWRLASCWPGGPRFGADPRSVANSASGLKWGRAYPGLPALAGNPYALRERPAGRAASFLRLDLLLSARLS